MLPLESKYVVETQWELWVCIETAFQWELLVLPTHSRPGTASSGAMRDCALLRP